MTNDKHINVYINSENKLNGTNSNFSINLPNDVLKCKEKQGLSLNLISLNIPNTMNYIINGVNNKFIVSIDNVVYEYFIEEGCYNVLTLRDYLNDLLLDKVVISYNRNNNRYTFTQVSLNTILKPINCSQFLGLENDIEYDLTNPISSVKGLDMVFRKKIIIETTNIHFEVSALENIGLNDSYFEQSQILYWCDKTDIPPNHIISYKNEDGGNSFNFKLHNKEISNIDFRIIDEYGNEYFDLPNFTMTLQFTIYERDENEMIETLIDINEYLKQIYTVILMIMKYFSVI